VRVLSIGAILVPLLVLGSGIAVAHAFLDHAEPKVGSTVWAAPREVSLSFTEKLEPAFCTVEVTDASGRRVDEGKPSIDGNVMRVQLRTLARGTYRVKWRVLSVDTHATEGAFSFQVGD
jgi:methionine-rich copper-binding protein CopC